MTRLADRSRGGATAAVAIAVLLATAAPSGAEETLDTGALVAHEAA